MRLRNAACRGDASDNTDSQLVGSESWDVRRYLWCNERRRKGFPSPNDYRGPNAPFLVVQQIERVDPVRTGTSARDLLDSCW